MTTRTDDPVVAPDVTGEATSSRPTWWGSPLGAVLPGLVVGALTAFVGIGRSSLWRDEAYSLGATHQLGDTLRETRGTMALYYLLLRGWTTVSEDPGWMRALSALVALAALVVAVRLVDRLVDRAVARWTGVLLGLSLLWVVYAQEARSYALVMLLTAVSWTAFDHLVADDDVPPRRRFWTAVHLGTAIALPLSQGLAALQVAAQLVALGAGRADRRAWRRLGPGVALAVAVTGILTVAGTGENGSWVVPVNAQQLRALFDGFSSDIPLLAVGLYVLGGLGAGHLLRGAAGGDPVARVRAVVPLAWAVVPPAALLAISLVGRPTLVPRYVAASAIGVAVLWAVAIRRLDRSSSFAAPVVGLVVVALLAIGQVRLHGSTGDDWRAAADAVAARAEPGDVVLLPDDELRPPFEAAWQEVEEPPAVSVLGSPRPLGPVRRFDEDIPDEDLTVAARAHSRVWVVAESREGRRREVIDELTGADGGYRVAGTWAEAGGVPATLLVRD